jgi:hypothetical protein
MAPEQCLAEEVDRRCDVFALGIVLWESTTGRRLFARDNELLVFKAICEDPVPKPSAFVPGYPPVLERIVLRALARHPDNRYATAADMRRDLMAATRELAGDSIPEDDLGTLMQQLFKDRIAAKADLLRQVSSGVNVGTVDWLEIDTDAGAEGSTVDMAAQTASGTRQSARSSAPSGFVQAAPVPPKSRLGLWLALAALALVGLGTFVGVMMIDSGEPQPIIVREERARPEAAAPPENEAPALNEEPTPAELGQVPAITNVTLDIESTPPGAHITVGGEARGVTPLALAIPQGTEPIEVTLDLAGYRTITERITPDMNQRVRVVLVRGAGRRPGATSARPTPIAPQPVAPPPPQPPAQRPGGFYRFD